MKTTFTLRRNRDGTATFRYGRYVEHIDPRHLGLMQTYEAIKYAAITAGLPLTEETLLDLMQTARGLKDDP